MKLTVLGKYGPYPAAGGGTSSYLLQGESTAVALDFGSGALGRLARFVAAENLRAVVLSHLHYDHICDLLPFSYCLKAKDKRVELIMPDTDCFQRKIIDDLDGFDIKFIKPNMRIGEFDFSIEKMRHPLESYSMRISSVGRTLFYSGDTAFCPEITEIAAGSDLLLLDCGRAENTPAPHLSLSEAAFIAKTLKAQTIATHLNPALNYVSPSPLVTVAREGETYCV